MGSMSISHWVIVLAVVMLVFGLGRISSLLGDIGRGIGIARRELKNDEFPEI